MVHKDARIGPGTMIWFRELSNIGNCEIGSGCNIHAPVWIADGVKIGNRVKIQAFTFIPPGVTIGDDVFIGPHVCFTNDKHPPSGGNWSKTIVARRAVIGAGAVILPVSIGEDAVVGAGAVVVRDVFPETTVVGNPAKPVRGSG